MEKQQLVIYNTLSRKKEIFEPLNAPNVGMYVCGPTVYGDPHLGHARPSITFDILFRYLKHLGYKVRYVRNITDVGHLEHDADEGDDKIEKKARLEQLEPMEIAQHYTNRYHDAMNALNVLPPSIEPQATGHIIEQEQLVKEIMDNGFAYESNGSIYFDTAKYNQKYHYGKLSGRNLDDVINASRELGGVEDKRNQTDFALWKKATPEHIMKWPSPWSEGFPGWHCECTAMGRKYLGSNMITINGKKMGKSLGNFITLEEFFKGTHEALTQAYSPMTIRFFILSAHYRGTVDFSNEALQAAEKGLNRLLSGIKDLDRIQPANESDKATSDFVKECRSRCYNAMNDDLQTPVVISILFEACHIINTIVDHKGTISAEDLAELKETMHLFAFDLMGLRAENSDNNQAREEAYGKVVDMVLDLRSKAKADKDWATSDKIRDMLADAGFEVKDTKDGAVWKLDK